MRARTGVKTATREGTIGAGTIYLFINDYISEYSWLCPEVRWWLGGLHTKSLLS